MSEMYHAGILAIFMHSCEKMRERSAYWEKDGCRENEMEFLIIN
jgi:hypothetical protein